MFDHVVGWLRRVGGRLDYAESVVGSTVEEQTELVALLRERPGGLSWIQLAGSVLERGSASAARAQLASADLFGDDEHAARLEDAHRDVRAWLADGLEFWTIVDERYPARVRDIQEAPPFLFARGHRVDGDVAVSVVGSRKASNRGMQMATSISEALVAMNVTVVAGLAAGIDTAAHETALRTGGRTVAVIGTGINRHYPAANRELQARIARDGLLLSQFWPDAPPQPHHFPMRNAVMSGYGVATVVVEAGERSGARIQARLAVQHGRPVILTDLVAKTTEWGNALLGRPDVYVASSIDDVTSVVRELMERPRQLGAVLSQIAV
jgi:DNA processing protein